MALSHRQRSILARLRHEGEVQVAALSRAFGVSEQTVRRDLERLCAEGLARRVHGGARLAGAASVSNIDYRARRSLNAAAKRAIGRAAARLIPDSCSVALNIGTTTEQVAQALRARRDLMVLTNNINIISILSDSPQRELVMAGGSVRPGDGAVIGAEAVAFISRYKVDFAVIGCSALEADGAVLDFDSREVSVARAILRNARARLLVSDGAKFGRNAPVRICALEEIDHFVTDRPPPEGFLAALERAGTELHLASPEDLREGQEEVAHA